MPTRSRSGFTILEMMLVLVTFTVVFGGAVTAIRFGQEQLQHSVSNTVLDSATNRALNQIARHLTGAGLTTLDPTPEAPFGSDSIRFERVEGWTAGAPVWSAEAELRFEYEPGEDDNGVDDDGDGLIDEGQVVWTRRRGEADEQSTVVVRSVAEFLEGEEEDGDDTNGNGLEDERGFCFELRGSELLVRLTVERLDPAGNRATRTLVTSVSIRN